MWGNLVFDGDQDTVQLSNINSIECEYIKSYVSYEFKSFVDRCDSTLDFF